MWEANTGVELLSLTNENLFNRAAFSPDEKRLALSACDNTVTVWDVANGENLLNLSSG